MRGKQDVVILGTGAFALEAMEAAHRGQARNITLLSSPRDRRAHSDAWIGRCHVSKQCSQILQVPRCWGGSVLCRRV